MITLNVPWRIMQSKLWLLCSLMLALSPTCARIFLFETKSPYVCRWSQSTPLATGRDLRINPSSALGHTFHYYYESKGVRMSCIKDTNENLQETSGGNLWSEFWAWVLLNFVPEFNTWHTEKQHCMWNTFFTLDSQLLGILSNKVTHPWELVDGIMDHLLVWGFHLVNRVQDLASSHSRDATRLLLWIQWPYSA